MTAPSRQERAEILGLRALAWIMGDSDRAERFLTQSGCDIDGLRRRADDPALLGAALDCLLGDEAALLDFAQSEGLDPASPAKARRLLPGAMPEFQAP